MSSRSASAGDRSRPRALKGTAPARPASTARARAARPAGLKQLAARRARSRRRRGLALLLVALVACVAAVMASGVFDTAVREITLPLRHEDVIRQQAAEKDLDATLIAGVIYAESRFRDGQVSSAGALGLMQITPATARDIARRSGGSAFTIEDLATPQVNISYGAFYLRYLLNRFGGDETLAIAAYNGGEGNVDRWIGEAAQRGEPFRVSAIPFKETREYVTRVRDAKREYRVEYARELGL